MSDTRLRIQVTAEQMQRMLNCVEDLRMNQLKQNPDLCFLLMESPLRQLQDLLNEQRELIQSLNDDESATATSTVDVAE